MVGPLCMGYTASFPTNLIHAFIQSRPRMSQRTLMPVLRRLCKRTEGQDLIEYALLVGIISVGLIAMIGALGTSVTQMYATTSAALNAAPNGPSTPGGPDAGNGNPGNGNPGNGNPGNGNPGNSNPGNGNPGTGNPNPGRGGGGGD